MLRQAGFYPADPAIVIAALRRAGYTRRLGWGGWESG